MSSIIFSDLVNNVISNSKIKTEIESLVQKKVSNLKNPH